MQAHKAPPIQPAYVPPFELKVRIMKPVYTLFTVALASAALLVQTQAMNDKAVNEVVKLHQGGLGDAAILAFIRNQGGVRYDLSSNDVLLLKNQGLSPTVLTAMLQSGASPEPSPAVVIPTPTLPAPMPLPAPPGATPAVVPMPGLSSDAAYFYQQLSPYGKWIMADDNQWYWQPAVMLSTPSWRPYWNEGHWVNTDSGWYWASDYPWGWAPFHYGRWRLHPLHGWIWFPDRVWAPAWVTWRSGGEYCGWAPLPPGASFDPSGGVVFRGKRVAVEFDFGLDWIHFSFCRVRDLGERNVFRREPDRRLIFGRTTVLDHQYAVERSSSDNRTEVVVVNRGVDPHRVEALRGRPLNVVTIHELRTPGPSKGRERFDREHKTLEVYRPHWSDHDGRH